MAWDRLGGGTMDFDEVIYSRRLQLRRVQDGDLPQLVAWSRCSTACGPCLTPEQHDLGQLRQQMAAGGFWGGRERLYMIELRNGSSIGVIHYWQPPCHEGEIIMALKIAVSSERNRGYGTEAQKYLIMDLFERRGVRSVGMYTDINNLPQQRCLAKLGFELVESLTYDDQQVRRTGSFYRLRREQYLLTPIYQYHFE